jgi:hypothetical protein
MANAECEELWQEAKKADDKLPKWPMLKTSSESSQPEKTSSESSQSTETKALLIELREDCQIPNDEFRKIGIDVGSVVTRKGEKKSSQSRICLTT